jgi:hypothetical protein
MRLLVSIFALLTLLSVAHAQTNPGFVTGAILCANTTDPACNAGLSPQNPIGLNQAFANKVDVSGGVTRGLTVTALGGTFNGPADAALMVNTNTANVGSLPPGTIVHLVNLNGVQARVLADGVANFGGFSCRRTDGTISAPTGPVVSEAICAFQGFGYGATGYISNPKAQIGMFAAETWSDTAFGTYISLFTSPTGGGSPALAERMRIHPSGAVSINNTVDPGSAGYLSVTGAAAITGLPTSAGAGGIFVCVDTSGVLYKKATCP